MQNGSYTIHEKVGNGAMGIVYRATHMTLQRAVAVKTLLDTDVQMLRRFEREAQTVAKLEHPHIIKVYDYGVDTFPDSNNITTPYFVMDLLTGGSLQNRLEANRERQQQYELHT